MNIDKLLGSYVNNIGNIVELLFIVVLVLFVPILYFSFKKKSESSLSSGELEETLKKVLEATRHQPASHVTTHEDMPPQVAGAAPAVAAAASAPAMEAPPASSADSDALKAQVAEREKMIAELKSKLTEAEQASKKAQATPGADASGFEARIKDLEAKLKEYEIIEDDIANLSLYKEENARLKDELNKLRPGGEAIVTPKADKIAQEMGIDVPPSEQLSEALKNAGPSNSENEIMAELNKAMAEAPASEPAPAAEIGPDLVSQLANVMGGAPAAAPVAVPTPAPAAEPLSPTPAVAATPAPVEASAPVAAPAPEPVADEAPDVLKSFDPDKIAEEAGNLPEAPTGTAAAAPAEEGDIGQKLIDEFENFMKETKT